MSKKCVQSKAGGDLCPIVITQAVKINALEIRLEKQQKEFEIGRAHV